MNEDIRNAKIESTFLGQEDHGILTCFLHLDYGGSGQGFGGYTLDSYDKTREKRVGVAYGMEFIRRVLEVLEAESWEKLPGMYCRVLTVHRRATGIGHITKRQWFYPETDLSEFIPSEEVSNQ